MTPAVSNRRPPLSADCQRAFPPSDAGRPDPSSHAGQGTYPIVTADTRPLTNDERLDLYHLRALGHRPVSRGVVFIEEALALLGLLTLLAVAIVTIHLLTSVEPPATECRPAWHTEDGRVAFIDRCDGNG